MLTAVLPPEVFVLSGDWVVWYAFADYLNWQSFLTLEQTLAEAADWNAQGVEVGILGPGGDDFWPGESVLANPAGAVLP